MSVRRGVLFFFTLSSPVALQIFFPDFTFYVQESSTLADSVLGASCE
jgi:hypothetical protein